MFHFTFLAIFIAITIASALTRSQREDSGDKLRNVLQRIFSQPQTSHEYIRLNDYADTHHDYDRTNNLEPSNLVFKHNNVLLQRLRDESDKSGFFFFKNMMCKLGVKCSNNAKFTCKESCKLDRNHKNIVGVHRYAKPKATPIQTLIGRKNSTSKQNKKDNRRDLIIMKLLDALENYLIAQINNYLNVDSRECNGNICRPRVIDDRDKNNRITTKINPKFDKDLTAIMNNIEQPLDDVKDKAIPNCIGDSCEIGGSHFHEEKYSVTPVDDTDGKELEINMNLYCCQKCHSKHYRRTKYQDPDTIEDDHESECGCNEKIIGRTNGKSSTNVTAFLYSAEDVDFLLRCKRCDK